MKRSSCLFKFIFIFTIFLAIIFYYLFNFPPAIKKVIVDFGLNKTKEQLAKLPQSPQKDSLELVLKDYADYLMKQNTINLSKIGEAADSLGQIIVDKEITPEEVSKFNVYIQKVISNERRTEN